MLGESVDSDPPVVSQYLAGRHGHRSGKLPDVTVNIRTAEPTDLTSLQTVYRRSSLSNDGDREALLNHPEHLLFSAQPVYDGRTRLAEDPKNGVVGFATLERHGDAAELVDLFVAPESMRRGIGRALLNDAIAALASDGIRSLWVTGNQHAIAFYSAMGFEVIETMATPLGSGIRMRLGITGREESTGWPTGRG
jgi:ribosomal protein S18 acetylase RimI-like enzyme